MVPTDEVAGKRWGFASRLNLINRTLRITSIACHARGHVRRRERSRLVDLVRVGVSTDPHENLGVRVEEHDVVEAQVVLAKVENFLARRADAADGRVAYLWLLGEVIGQ